MDQALVPAIFKRGRLRLSRYKWKKRVEQVMERDGHKCRMCGRSEGLADVHHIIKRSQGGGDDMDNLITLCRNCHNKQHAQVQFNKLYPKGE
jgi:5-methylcytosine-specific restriction endonuclease McrA